jgi:hypothetical protein
LIDHQNIIGLRDNDSVDVLVNKLKEMATRVAVIGNGGISLELIHAVRARASRDVIYKFKIYVAQLLSCGLDHQE